MKLQIKNIDRLRDGGTVEIKCLDSTYYVDYRMTDGRNGYRGMLFSSYPTEHTIPLPKNEAKETKKLLLLALKEFGVQSQKYQEWLPTIKEIKI